MGPQLFSGWYQMILDVCQCSQLFFDVFSWVVTFMDNHPLCGHFFSGCPQLITDILYRFSDVFKICSDVLRCSQMFSDDHRCFWIFSRYSIDVLLMFSRCSLDVPRMIAGFFSGWSFQMKDPKELDDPQLIPDICHGRHGYTRVNFYRFNAKNWHFRQILRKKVAFFLQI